MGKPFSCACNGVDVMNNSLEFQRFITQIALEASKDGSFALAGSGAIREHGLISRPTEDIDLFSIMSASENFSSSVDSVSQKLRDAGLSVDVTRRTDSFARLTVSSDNGQHLEIDMGIDWRNDLPVSLEIGSVLSRDDAVGNKMAALFSRGEARDYLDVDGIRQAGFYSDDELIALGKRTDPSFDNDMFCQRLEDCVSVSFDEISKYGYSRESLTAMQQRLTQWADVLKSAKKKH